MSKKGSIRDSTDSLLQAVSFKKKEDTEIDPGTNPSMHLHECSYYLTLRFLRLCLDAVRKRLLMKAQKRKASSIISNAPTWLKY
jgi:hypothetical protein